MTANADNPTHGRLSAGIMRESLVKKTIAFVRNHLQPWRDDSSRPRAEAEDDLNAQLCKFLNAAEAREHFPMVHFNLQERQGRRRTVDMSATPSRHIRAESWDCSIYTPFLVLEGKRLPTPHAEREREYLTGHERRSGGVQRFKLGLHGAEVDTAVLVGYLQDDSAAKWHRRLNGWIIELAESPGTEHDCWVREECLSQLVVHSNGATTECQSSHLRASTASTARIRLFHLWIEMRPATTREH